MKSKPTVHLIAWKGETWVANCLASIVKLSNGDANATSVKEKVTCRSCVPYFQWIRAFDGKPDWYLFHRVLEENQRIFPEVEWELVWDWHVTGKPSLVRVYPSLNPAAYEGRSWDLRDETHTKQYEEPKRPRR